MDKRSEAIRKCGKEIVKLRKHIEVVDQERRRLDSQLKALHMSTAAAEMVSKIYLFPDARGGRDGVHIKRWQALH